MLNLKKLSVTGDPGSGKSTVCSIFKELGSYIVSADDIVRELLVTTSSVGQKVIQLLGPSIVKEDRLDRQTIANMVFDDIYLLKELEGILHPEVHKIIQMNYKKVCRGNDYSLFVAEIPLLYESNSESFYDIVIFVSANQNLCMSRFLYKKGCSQQEFYRRLKRFLPIEERKTRANFVIENNGTIEQLREKIIKLNTLIL